jgi:hypothetical protein
VILGIHCFGLRGVIRGFGRNARLRHWFDVGWFIGINFFFFFGGRRRFGSVGAGIPL